MPLFNVDGERITKIPHQAQFDEWKSRLNAQEKADISNAFAVLIDRKIATNEKIVTSGWLPKELCNGDSHEWDGTPFFVIWEKACRQNWEHTGWCFGLFVWEFMMDHDEKWIFIKGTSDEIQSTTYFIGN